MIQFEDTQAPDSTNKHVLSYYELINHNDYLLLTMMIKLKPKTDGKLKTEGKPKRAKVSKPAGKKRVAGSKSATKTVRKQGPVQSMGPRSSKRKKN